MCGIATEPQREDRQRGECPGLENGQSEDVERFVGVPAELGAIDAHEEDAVGNFRTRIAGSFGKSRDFAVHAAPSCFGCE